MSSFTLSAPAKLNLFFDVCGRRTDGFHNVVSITILLNVEDTVTLTELGDNSQEVSPPRISLLERPGYPFGRNGILPPTDSRNLVLQAAEKFFNALTLRLDHAISHSLEFVLEKNLPLEAGLGGGSSDAATTLLLLNEYYDYPFNLQEIRAIGSELGSDVPLFLLPDMAARGTGRGECLTPLPFWPGGELVFLLLKPPFGLSTPEVYRRWDEEHRDEVHPNEEHWTIERICPEGYKNNENHERTPDSSETFLTAWQQGEPAVLEGVCYNCLEAIALRMRPELGQYKDFLERLGLRHVHMTGSGTCLYSICSTREQAEELAQRLHREVPGLYVTAATARTGIPSWYKGYETGPQE